MSALRKTNYQHSPRRISALYFGSISIGIVLGHAAALAVIGAGALGLSQPASAAEMIKQHYSSRDAAIQEMAASPSANQTEADLQRRAPQDSDPAKGDAKMGDNTIVVAFNLPQPFSIDDDVARRHGLMLVDRTELHSFGLRVVRYRVQKNQPLKPIIANLRNDRRILSVQVNAEYRSLARSEATKEPVPDADPQSSQYEARDASSRRSSSRDVVASNAGNAPVPAQSGPRGGMVASVARSTNRTLTYERQRQQLLERLATAEEVRKMAMHKLEALERLHGLAASDGIGVGRHASPRPRGVSSDVDSLRLTNLRRRCIEIKIDPEGYEETLVEFCRTL